jgi:hypothetical protein
MSLHDGVNSARLLVPIGADDIDGLVLKLQRPTTAFLHASVAPRGVAR